MPDFIVRSHGSHRHAILHDARRHTVVMVMMVSCLPMAEAGYSAAASAIAGALTFEDRCAPMIAAARTPHSASCTAEYSHHRDRQRYRLRSPPAQWQTASGGKLPPWDRRRSHPTKWRFRQWALFELTSSDIGLERVKDSAVSRPYGVPSGLPRRNLPELLLSLATQLSARIATVLIKNKESSVASLFCFKEQISCFKE